MIDLNRIFIVTWCTRDMIEDIEDDMWDCAGFASMPTCVSRNLDDALATVLHLIRDEYATMHDFDDDVPAPDTIALDTEPETVVNELSVYHVRLDGKFYGSIVARYFDNI